MRQKSSVFLNANKSAVWVLINFKEMVSNAEFWRIINAFLSVVKL